VKTVQQWMDWSGATFSKATAHSSFCKLEDEMKELYEALQEGDVYRTREEIIDCIMCLLHIAERVGCTGSEIAVVFRHKFNVNRDREWIENTNGSYSHKK